MKIKHSKYKNTGLIYELLVRQIVADTLLNKPSAAVKILKNYFRNSSSLAKEYKLYEFILKNKGSSRERIETILSTITEISRKLDQNSIKNQKYKLIAEIKKHYNIDDFFSIKIAEYKTLASFYCLLEAQNIKTLVDPQILVENKITLIECLTSKPTSEDSARDSLIEEYSKYEKDLKLLTYKILLEKFNKKYNNLNQRQKEVLREFITSVSSTTKLKDYINFQLQEIKVELNTLNKKVSNKIMRIKLNEVSNNITFLSKKDKVQDSNLTLLLQYYELLEELKKA